MRADPFYSYSIAASLDDVSLRQQKLSRELSSGLAVSSPGDDPLAAAGAVQLSGAIARDDAYTQAATSLESRLQVSDSALGSAVTQITSAISLAVQGQGGTLDSEQLQVISQQIAAVRDQVLSLANTNYAGTFLFAGTKGTTQPFTLDTTTSPATTTYSGDAQTQTVQTPTGQRITTGLPGSAIFTASGADVLGSLNQLVADFTGGSVASTTTADLTALRSGLTTLTTQRSVLGAGLGALQSTISYTATDATNLTAAQTSLVSADTASVATQLSASEAQQQALEDTFASTTKTDLFAVLQ